MARPDLYPPAGPEEWAGLRLLRVLVDIAAATNPAIQPGDDQHEPVSSRPEGVPDPPVSLGATPLNG